MKSTKPHGSFQPKSQAGMSLLETMIALTVLLITTTGIMGIALVATSATENQGHLAARTTEYAQDKMEQLMGLAYGDSTTDTTVFPAITGGTGLSIGGSSDPNAPVAGYVDYLDISGNPLPSAGGVAPLSWYYKRAWQISTPAGTTNLKQITVTTVVQSQVGSLGALPQSTVVALKTDPF